MQAADPFVELLTDLAEPTADDEVLDLGVFPGLVSLALAPQVASLIALVERDEVIAEGRRLATEIGVGNVMFDYADPTALPFAEGAFSLVVACEVLHLLESPAAVFGELRRVMRSGARMAIIEPVLESHEQRALEELAQLRWPGHRRFLSRREIETAAAGAGLRVTRSELLRQSYDLDFWMQSRHASRRRALARATLQRFRELSLPEQIALDVVLSDDAVSFSYDVVGLRLEID